MDLLAGLGVVLGKSLRADDVTDEYLDLESPILVLEQLVEQLELLLATAKTVEEALKIRIELDRVRVELEAARVRNVTQDRQAQAALAPPPQRFDGVVIRSDGSSTRWLNGQPQVGASGLAGLKPGQIRADGRVYEPYEVLRPRPTPQAAEGPTQ